MDRPTAVIFDMDGTLVDIDSVLHHVQSDDPDFHAFHSASINCPPHIEVIALVEKAMADGHAILVVTAREEKWRAISSFWLAMNSVHSDALFMRSNGDYRNDFEIKYEIYQSLAQLWNVVHAVDDNPVVLKLWEKLNIPTTKIGTWELD